ncbi:Segregation and condensation protein B [Mycoplasmopsis agalactiae]|uniref:Segregation and condensation protein B n=2 Tax=Mycoplasmopsis agalactiae TaxID=2110 RepID=A5IZG1_MYCAP|nr:SMC-Scp complex subunit ScpB [Mycoplasmopsis agalactiae]KAB6718679.1 segregation/condensation protein B [Mycoplasmopsis agalactiae]MCE6057441.1 segregation/condensation protein B [Mycoplasmopsis agalactiae]MCE6061917.1 segregation/condensation protein B [Mycoplasmopsis agalactiae]MCE6079216.1 segregation/condensation protein B [Mycoplasmopsis agalactiae]MCE6091127.1 segregation/condensation protein B [Mycoplasmopsis agalactiae]
MKNKILEALLYVQGDEGLTLEQVKDIFGLNTISEARKVMNDFVRAYNDEDRALKVVNFNEVFKLATREAYKEYITKMVQVVKKHRLSNAAIEVAGIVAYKQPVTRSQINNLRGVASEQVLNTLLTKGVVEEVGISPTPGNPILYGVTNKFYDYFKLKSTYELPKLTEFNYSDGTENEAKDFNLFDGIRVDVE